MAARASAPDDRAVFLNVPFDVSYEPVFLGIIASLVSLGRTPRCVLEIADSGQGRLRRILNLMESCRVSIHDLSRVGGPARFNMPFELGLVYAMRAYRSTQNRYLFVILESTPHRLSRTLSDMAAHDPAIHHGTGRGAIRAVLHSLGTPSIGPFPEDVDSLYTKLGKVARELKRRDRTPSLFTRGTFLRTVAAATTLASQASLISP